MLERHSPSRFWKGRRRYYHTPGGDFPGVTTVLGATRDERSRMALARWKRRVGYEEAERIRDEASARGTKLHDEAERYLLKGEVPRKVSGWFMSLDGVLAEIGEVMLVEGAVWHPDGFAGTVDLVAFWRGEDRVIDWKSGNRPKQERYTLDARHQVAAYCAAINRMYGTRIGYGGIAVALEDQDAQVFELDRLEMMRSWDAFRRRLDEFHQRVR